MSVGVATAKSQRCLKRLLDEPRGALPKHKRICLAPPSTENSLSPCLPQSPSPKSDPNPSPVRVGPYVLLERCEGEETYRAVHALTQQPYTCQVLPLLGYQEKLAAYARVGRHDNICDLLDTVIGQDRVYVFLPDHYGDMHAYVRSSKRLAEEEAASLFTQMLSAVEHCHHHGVVLRDLKLRRFVFMDRFRTRIALFGLNDCVVLQGDYRADSLTDRHGCPAYVGPELLTKGNATYSGRAADVWSLGVSLYTMLIGRYPFQDTQPAALFAKIRSGTFSLPSWISSQAKCLIGCMLRKTPAERLEASELLIHPWLTNRCPTHHAPPTHRGVSKTLTNKEEEDDQVVPTWTEKP